MASSRSLIFKATADNHSPVEGTVLHSLSQNTRLGVAECEMMKQLLDKRIRKTSPDVKYKALRTVVYLSENGAPEFRMQWQRDNGALREHTLFKGTKDPLRGETPNVRVREEAKKAMKAIFSTSTKPKSTGLEGKITSVGSTNASTGFGNTSSSPFGNGTDNSFAAQSQAMFSSITSSIISTVKGAGGPSTAAPTAPNTSSKYGGYGSDGKFVPATSKNFALTSTPFESSSTTGYKSSRKEVWSVVVPNGVNVRVKPTVVADKSGPNLKFGEEVIMIEQKVGPEHWIKHHRGWSCARTPQKVLMQPKTGSYSAPTYDDPEPKAAESTANPYPDSSNPYPTLGEKGTSFAAQGSTVAPSSAPVQATEYENRLVSDLCKPTGVKMIPPRAEMKAFIIRCHSLNLVAICQALQGQLASSAIKSKGKALHVLGALISTFGERVGGYFKAQPQTIQALSNSVTPSLRNKAKEVLVALGLHELEVAQAPAPAPAQRVTYAPAPVAQKPANLFEVEDETPAPAPKPTAQPVSLGNLFDEPKGTSATNGGESSAFGFLGGEEEEAAAPAEANSTAFNFLGREEEGRKEEEKQASSAFAFMDDTSQEPAAGGSGETKTDISMVPGLGALQITEKKSPTKRLDPLESLMASSKHGGTPPRYPQQGYTQGYPQGFTQQRYQHQYPSQAYQQNQFYYQQQQQQRAAQGYGYQGQRGYSKPTKGNGDSNVFFMGGLEAPKPKPAQPKISMDMFTSPTTMPIKSGGEASPFDLTSGNTPSTTSATRKKKKKEDDSFAFVGDLMK